MCFQAETSLLLIKPDGVRLGISNEIEQMLKNECLCIVNRQIRRLTKQDIIILYPELSFELTPITNTFLHCYLLNKEIELFLVNGNEVVSKLLGIKNILREKYKKHLFASVIHTSDSIAEFERQKGLLTLDRLGEDKVVSIEGSSVLRSNKILLPISQSELHEIVTDMLEKWQPSLSTKDIRRFYAPLLSLHQVSELRQLILLEDDNTIDEVILNMVKVITGLSFKLALQIILDVSSIGKGVIAICTLKQAISYQNELCKCGLNVILEHVS